MSRTPIMRTTVSVLLPKGTRVTVIKGIVDNFHAERRGTTPHAHLRKSEGKTVSFVVKSTHANSFRSALHSAGYSTIVGSL